MFSLLKKGKGKYGEMFRFEKVCVINRYMSVKCLLWFASEAIHDKTFYLFKFPIYYSLISL